VFLFWPANQPKAEDKIKSKRETNHCLEFLLFSPHIIASILRAKKRNKKETKTTIRVQRERERDI
jgi:hypothetical protein